VNWILSPEPASENTDRTLLLKTISEGKADDYLAGCAASFRKFQEPILINFSPGFDREEPGHEIPESVRTQAFIKAWQYVYTFFNELGVSNITWVWNPASPNSIGYYPGSQFVDWIGVDCLNYGRRAGSSEWYSFEQLYEPYRNSFGRLQKPVILTQLGSIAGPAQREWISTSCNEISRKYKEIHSCILTDKVVKSSVYKNGLFYPYTADFTLSGPATKELLASHELFEENTATALQKYFLLTEKKEYHSAFIKGKPGDYQLIVNNKPYYIRGVAYNTAHDWRDGNMPLSRRQLESDFKKIKAMGANTIRRYDHGIYDRNIVNIAGEYDLNVLYGFWFDPKVDYFRDSNRVKEYIEDVLEKVSGLKDEPSVLAWSLGNETWGLLKHHYAKPYLTKVRNSYARLIEYLAQKIHEEDPGRPVFSCMEHEEYQLPGELAAFHDMAPSIDVIGVNSYYREQISKLNHVTWEFDSLRPYLVSEFGPIGYWDPHHNKISAGNLLEESDGEKAAWYKEQWLNYVAGYKGYNIGGFAYCWHDRMEGSYTWFGLTDYKGRPKPAYYALRSIWTKEQKSLPDYKIDAPLLFVPGKKYTIRASGPDTGKITYEWMLLRDGYLDKINTISPIGNGKTISLEVPTTASAYRLYLFAGDEEGNVSTASHAVTVH
ncbi:MAG: glycoside hydrolase family 2 TIM barrel-domain containing protein, partial [Bacteroidia bacterium]